LIFQKIVEIRFLFGWFQHELDSRTFELVPSKMIKIRIPEIVIIKGFDISLKKIIPNEKKNSN